MLSGCQGMRGGSDLVRGMGPPFARPRSSITGPAAMTGNPNSPEKRQMAEPRPAPEGADTGGMRSTADAGLSRAAQRSTEHAETDPVGPAPTENAGGVTQTPRPDPGDAGRTSAAMDDDEDKWRHEPREPVDESPLKSFGKSIGETLTGSVDDATPPPKTRR